MKASELTLPEKKARCAQVIAFGMMKGVEASTKALMTLCDLSLEDVLKIKEVMK